MTRYFEKTKENWEFITPVEIEFLFENPWEIAKKMFSKDFFFIPKDLRKNQKIYDFVLVDSDSIGIKHYKSKDGPTFIIYSVVQILKVLTPTAWGTNPYQFKKFSQPFGPIGCNYWDYRDAWFNAFSLQNYQNRHSWLFYFKKGY